MVLRRSTWVILLAALAALLIWWALPGKPSVGVGPAHADSGFCGVRNDSGATFATTWYVVRNKCTGSHTFAVRKHWAGGVVQSGCKRIAAKETGYYTFSCPYCQYDPNWSVVNC